VPSPSPRVSHPRNSLFPYPHSHSHLLPSSIPALHRPVFIYPPTLLPSPSQQREPPTLLPPLPPRRYFPGRRFPYFQPSDRRSSQRLIKAPSHQVSSFTSLHTRCRSAIASSEDLPCHPGRVPLLPQIHHLYFFFEKIAKCRHAQSSQCQS